MLRILLLSVFAFCCVFVFGCVDRTSESSLARKAEPEVSSHPVGQTKGETTPQIAASTEKHTPAETKTIVLPTMPRSDNMKEVVEEAKVFFDKLVIDFPADNDAFDSRARFYFLIGDHDVARACWEEAVRLNAHDSYSLNGLGLIYQANNDFNSALNFFQMASMHKPNDPTVKINIVKSFLKLGRLQEAIQVGRECTLSHPDSVEAWELLGQSCLANQDYEEANKAYAEAVRRAPQNFVALQGLSATLIRLNRRDEAKKWLELQKESRSKLKKSESLYQAAEIHNVSQHLSLAANVFLKHQKKDLAINTMRYAVACAPKEESPKQALIDLYQKLGRIDEAIDLAKTLVQQAPQRIGYRFGLAELYARNKNQSLTEQTLNEAISLEPKNAQGYFLLLKLLLASGKNNARQLELSQALVTLRGNASDFALLAQVHHANGNSTSAIDALQTAIQKDPDNASYRAILSQLESKKSKP